MSTNTKYIFSKQINNLFPLSPNVHVYTVETFEEAAELYNKSYYNFIYINLKKDDLVYKVSKNLNDAETADYEVDNIVFHHVGFSLQTDSSTCKISLYSNADAKKYKDVMIVYNGQMIPIDLIPPHLRYLISDKAHIPTNPVPATAQMYSDKGKMIVSSCNVMGLPQHIFFPMIEKMDDIHFKEQWLSSSSDLNQEQYIGYTFNSDTYRLHTVKMIPRLGTHDKPGIQSPAPKLCLIEGLLPNTDKWEAITEEIEFDRSMWSFLTPIELTLSEEETDFYQGFRIRVLEWFPGATKDMLTGLMRLEFLCTAPHAIKTPAYVTPDLKNLVYAQFNSMFLDTAPRPKYSTPVKKEEPKPEITTTDDSSLATIRTIINRGDDIVVANSLSSITPSYTYTDSIIPFISISNSNVIKFTKDDGIFYQKDTVGYVNMTDSTVTFEAETPLKFVLLQYKNKKTSKLSINSGDILIVRKTADDLILICVDNSVE